MNLLNGILLMLVGVVFLAIARDKLYWGSYALESFRYCTGIGYASLGGRMTWIYFYGDEVGIHVWGQVSLFALGIGQIGLLVNFLTIGTIDAPRFVKRVLE